MHTTVSKWLFLAFAKQGAPRYLGLRPKNLATAQLKSATVECFQLFPAPHVLINQGLKENCMFFFFFFSHSLLSVLCFRPCSSFGINQEIIIFLFLIKKHVYLETELLNSHDVFILHINKSAFKIHKQKLGRLCCVYIIPI